MPQTLYTVLNAANNYKSEIRLSAPIEEDFCRFLANRETLIYASFLADGYVYNINVKGILPVKGTALAGSKLAFSVKEKPFYNATIELADKTNAQELQVAMYFFS